METLADAPEADLCFRARPMATWKSIGLRRSARLERDGLARIRRRLQADHSARRGAMKPDTFACFVVGDFRDGRGFYRNFVSRTRFRNIPGNAARLYNGQFCCKPRARPGDEGNQAIHRQSKAGKAAPDVLVFCKATGKLRRVALLVLNAQRRWSVTLTYTFNQRSAQKHRRHKASGQSVDLLTEILDMSNANLIGPSAQL